MKNLQLIDGKFNSSEANETLMTMVSSMIQFHINKNFISEYRTGQSDNHSVHQIAELREVKEDLLALLKEAEKNNLMIEVQSSVNISCVAKNQLEKI